MPRYYEEVELGDELGPMEKVATDEAVTGFCDISGRPGSNRFTDDATARSEGLPAAIVPGIMSLAYLAQLVCQWAEGGSLKRLDVVFRQFVLHQQPLRLVGVVTDKNRVDSQGQVECDVYLENAAGERLVGGKATLIIPDMG